MTLQITVHGIPAPQGSKRAFVTKHGRAVVVDDNKPQLRTWREDVKHAALAELDAGHTPVSSGPVAVTVLFYLPRPKHHYGVKGGVPYLKPNAPVFVDKRPDLDKLIRSTCDALTAAGAYGDDNQVVDLVAEKRYAGGRYAHLDEPGALITITPANTLRYPTDSTTGPPGQEALL